MLGLDRNASMAHKALHGSVGAWERLVKRHERLVFNYTYRMTGNAEDALDLMQEVFLAVFRNLHQFRQDGNFKAWLMRIAANRTIDFFRRRRPEEDDPESTLALVSDARFDPDGALRQSENNAVVLRLLNEISAEQRVVIELKFFQNLTFDEIGDTLEISPNTVKSRFYAALRQLKNHLEVTDVAL